MRRLSHSLLFPPLPPLPPCPPFFLLLSGRPCRILHCPRRLCTAPSQAVAAAGVSSHCRDPCCCLRSAEHPYPGTVLSLIQVPTTVYLLQCGRDLLHVQDTTILALPDLFFHDRLSFKGCARVLHRRVLLRTVLCTVQCCRGAVVGLQYVVVYVTRAVYAPVL